MLHVTRQRRWPTVHMPCSCTHAWLMSHVISLRQLQYIHIPCLCVKALAKGIYHWTTSDAYTPWLTLYAVGKNILTNIYMLHLMLASHIPRRQMNVCSLRTMLASHVKI